jgi:hypothetical protein
MTHTLQALAFALLNNPPDRTALRAAINRKVKEWRETLRSTHLAEARLILQQLIGPIVVYAKHEGDTRPFVPDVDFVPSRLLAEEAVVWSATVNPVGLLRAADSNHMRMASPTGSVETYELPLVGDTRRAA